MKTGNRDNWRIGDWQVDVRTLTITRESDSVRLEPRAMDVLVCLAAAAPDVVTQDELMDRVWGKTVVGPNALTRIIAQLRRAFGDDAKNPVYIETISRTGYRLVAIAEPQVRRTQRINRFTLVAVAIIACAAAFFLFEQKTHFDNAVIAVLPFANLSGDESIDYIGDGLSEEVINSLSQLTDIKVVSRTSSFVFKGAQATAAEIGTRLGATHIVEGSVRQQRGFLRVTAQLIDTASGHHVWSRTYERPVADIFAIQDQIALALAEIVEEHLGAAPQGDVAVARTMRAPENPEAYDLYLRGRYLWNRRSRDSISRAIESFHESIVIDPQFGRAWAGLAAAYNTLPAYDRSADRSATFALAVEAAERALMLDANLGEAHAVIAAFEQTQGQWQKAEAHYQIALKRTPDRATVLYWYSEMLTMVGRVSDALTLVNEASSLNPLYFPVYIDKGFNQMGLGDFESGMASFKRGRALGSEKIHIQLWFGYLVGFVHAEDWNAALAWLDERPFKAGVENDRAYIEAKRSPTADNIAISENGILKAFHGGRTDPKLAIHILAQLDRFDSAIEVARALHSNGYHDWRSLWGPGYSDFRQQPAFHKLVEDLGLVDYWQAYGWGDFCIPNESGFECR